MPTRREIWRCRPASRWGAIKLATMPHREDGGRRAGGGREHRPRALDLGHDASRLRGPRLRWLLPERKRQFAKPSLFSPLPCPAASRLASPRPIAAPPTHAKGPTAQGNRCGLAGRTETPPVLGGVFRRMALPLICDEGVKALSEQRQVVCVGRSTRRPKRRLGREGAPLGHRGGAPLFVNLAGDEMALLIEMVVDLGMN